MKQVASCLLYVVLFVTDILAVVLIEKEKNPGVPDFFDTKVDASKK